MATKKAMIEYIFLFDPDSAWNSISAFESDLAQFFAAYGFEANLIKTVDGQLGRRLIEISKMDAMSMETNFHNKTMPNPVGRPKNFVTVLNEKRQVKQSTAQERNFKQGTFLKSKGYVRR